MYRKNNLTTILILAGFFISAFLMVRAFTCVKAGELNDFLMKHYYGYDFDTEEEWLYTHLYLDEKYDLFWDHHFNHGYYWENRMPEKISEALPKTQLEMFLSYHDYNYMYSGNMYKLSDDEEQAAWIAMMSWVNLISINKIRDYVIWTIVICVMIGILAYRKKLCKDKESEEGMANTLSKGLAYEMAEPMRGLRDALEEWKNASESEKNAISGKVIAEVDQMDEGIKNLLQLRDFDAGNIDLHFEEVNLYYLTNAVLKRLNPVLSKKILTAQVETQAPEDCIVKADPQILKLVLSNVIMKTADYSSRKIRITLVVGRTVQFQVVSDDYQIPKDEARSVWKFYSLYDDCKADEIGSSGVGLAAAARMLDAHKAKYGCQPVQRGTMLWFEMKRIRDHE